MKISLEHEEIVVTIEDKEAVTLNDTLDLMEQALLGIGFRFNGMLDIVETELPMNEKEYGNEN